MCGCVYQSVVSCAVDGQPDLLIRLVSIAEEVAMKDLEAVAEKDKEFFHFPEPAENASDGSTIRKPLSQPALARWSLSSAPSSGLVHLVHFVFGVNPSTQVLHTLCPRRVDKC